MIMVLELLLLLLKLLEHEKGEGKGAEIFIHTCDRQFAPKMKPRVRARFYLYLLKIVSADFVRLRVAMRGGNQRANYEQTGCEILLWPYGDCLFDFSVDFGENVLGKTMRNLGGIRKYK